MMSFRVVMMVEPSDGDLLLRHFDLTSDHYPFDEHHLVALAGSKPAPQPNNPSNHQQQQRLL